MAETVTTVITPNRGISSPSPTGIFNGPSANARLVADCYISEQHEDEAVLVEHPIEQGSTITDHMYYLPAVVRLEYGFSLSSPATQAVAGTQSLTVIYNYLLQLQKQAILFSVFTGKRAYTNMAMKSLRVETNAENENVLRVVATCRQVLMAATVASNFPPASANANPAANAATQQVGVGQVTPTNAPIPINAAQAA